MLMESNDVISGFIVSQGCVNTYVCVCIGLCVAGSMICDVIASTQREEDEKTIQAVFLKHKLPLSPSLFLSPASTRPLLRHVLQLLRQAGWVAGVHSIVILCRQKVGRGLGIIQGTATLISTSPSACLVARETQAKYFCQLAW